MKVFLVYPYHRFLRRKGIFERVTRYRQPLGLAYCASMLKEKGIEARIIDANVLKMPDRGILEKVKNGGPDMVFIATEMIDSWQCPFPVYDETVNVSRMIKAHRKGLPIGIIGPHGTSKPKEVLERTGADFIVMGEPEATVVDVCMKAKKGKGFISSDGLAHMEGGKLRVNRPRKFIEDLDSMPFPDYGQLPMDKYYHNFLSNRNFSILVTSRGCPFQCTFCLKNMWGSKYRTRSVKNVIEEIRLLHDKYDVGSLYIQDLEFLLDKKRVIELCNEIIRNKFDLEWGCTARVSSIDRDVLKALKDSKCKFILFGVEAIDPVVLKEIKKDIRPEDVKKSVELCKEFGIHASINTMIGLPKQTKESYRKDIEKLSSYSPQRITTGITIALPGTELYRKAESSGIVKEGTWDECLEFSGTMENDFKRKELRNMFEKNVSRMRRKWLVKEFSGAFFLKPRFYKWLFKVVRMKLAV